MTATLESLHGRIGDLDSHEAVPLGLYGEVFGEIGKRFEDGMQNVWQAAGMLAKESGHKSGLHAVSLTDSLEINQENVWTIKGSDAPGSVDMNRRATVMDTMGIRRQLIFPMMGLFAWEMSKGGGRLWIPKATPQQKELGRLAVDAYNDWAAKLTGKFKNRMWFVGILRSEDPEMTPELLTKEAEKLIDRGCRAIMMSSGLPPAGLSCGDRKLDPLYDLLAKNDITLTFHPPAGGHFRGSEIWESSLLQPQYATVTTQHCAEENFIAIMILSGVFDRHPNLRVAVVETGADWVGPLAERMDDGPSRPLDHSKLSMKPSGYLARNVRVSTMVGEPVERWLERWPHLQPCYCYSSDYPHVEGGEWSLKRLFERVKPLGDDVVEKYFVTNSYFVLPEAA